MLSITHVFLLTHRNSLQRRFISPRVMPVCTPSLLASTCSISTTLPCSIFTFLPICVTASGSNTLPDSASHTCTCWCVPLHPCPDTACNLCFLSFPPACWHQSLFKACKSPCARQEDGFLIHPHYQQSASTSEQPCQLLRNETIASIWWISWLSTLLIRQMNWKKKHSLLWTNDSLTSLLFKTWLTSFSYFYF